MADTIDEWLDEGLERGWILPPPPYSGKTHDSCSTHDGVATTPEEDAQFEAGLDPCLHVLRLNPGATG